jgi:hypothetical protein
VTRKLREGEVQIMMGPEAMVAAEAIGICRLKLPNGHILILRDCLLVPDLFEEGTFYLFLSELDSDMNFFLSRY